MVGSATSVNEAFVIFGDVPESRSKILRDTSDKRCTYFVGWRGYSQHFLSRSRPSTEAG